MALDRYYPLSKQPVLRGLDAYAASWMVATPSRAASLPVHISRGVQSYLYANRVGFFVGKLELLFVPALAYLLLRAPVEERYRAHTLLDLTDLQLGPIHACLLAHQLSDTLPLLFFAQVSRDRLLFVSYRTSYETGASVHPPETLPFSAPCQRTSQTILFPEQNDELLNLNHFHLIDFYRMRDRCGWRVENNRLSPLLSRVYLKHIGELVGPQ